MRNNNHDRNRGWNPFREQFQRDGVRPTQDPEKARFWELVAVAKVLAELYRSTMHGLERGSDATRAKLEELKGSKEFKASLSRLALAKQAFLSEKETTKAVRSIQRMIVRGDLEEGVLFYVNAKFVPATRTFKWAFRALPEDVKEKHEITDAVSPPNGIAILRALNELSGKPEFLEIFMGFKKTMEHLGWINWEPRESKPVEPAPTAEPTPETPADQNPPPKKTNPRAQTPKKDPAGTQVKAAKAKDRDKADEVDIREAKGKSLKDLGSLIKS